MEMVSPVTAPRPAGVIAPDTVGGIEMDLVTAERALEASTGSCMSACRALGSMDRATGRLCSLASSPEDTRTCDESKTKLVAARERVRASCTSCPGGPTVDPNAAIPSP
jgi:hypothetical protein